MIKLVLNAIMVNILTYSKEHDLEVAKEKTNFLLTNEEIIHAVKEKIRSALLNGKANENFAMEDSVNSQELDDESAQLAWQTIRKATRMNRASYYLYMPENEKNDVNFDIHNDWKNETKLKTLIDSLTERWVREFSQNAPPIFSSVTGKWEKIMQPIVDQFSDKFKKRRKREYELENLQKLSLEDLMVRLVQTGNSSSWSQEYAHEAFKVIQTIGGIAQNRLETDTPNKEEEKYLEFSRLFRAAWQKVANETNPSRHIHLTNCRDENEGNNVTLKRMYEEFNSCKQPEDYRVFMKKWFIDPEKAKEAYYWRHEAAYDVDAGGLSLDFSYCYELIKSKFKQIRNFNRLIDENRRYKTNLITNVPEQNSEELERYGHVSAWAREIGISRSTIRYRLKGILGISGRDSAGRFMPNAFYSESTIREVLKDMGFED